MPHDLQPSPRRRAGRLMNYPTTKKGEAMSEKRQVDWSVARQTCQGDEELLRDIISTFLDEIPRIMQTIRASIDVGDTTELQRAVHTLKGSLGHFGAHDAYQVANQLETQVRDGDMSGAVDSMPALEQAMAQLTPLLLDYVSASDAQNNG